MWFLFILLLCVLFYVLLATRTDRRVQLINLIQLHQIDRLEWHHRGRVRVIMLTPDSTASASRNRKRGIGVFIILKHFWLEGKLHNTDAFDMANLRFSASRP